MKEVIEGLEFKLSDLQKRLANAIMHRDSAQKNVDRYTAEIGSVRRAIDALKSLPEQGDATVDARNDAPLTPGDV